MNASTIDLEAAKDEVRGLAKDAREFVYSEFVEDWTTAERYIAGEADVTLEVGRSSAVRTVVRDTIRSLMPSIMREFVSDWYVVDFHPYSATSMSWAGVQSEYISKRFWDIGGFNILQNAIEESLSMRYGPVKTYYEENPAPEYVEYTGVSLEDFERLNAEPDIYIDSVKEHEVEVSPGEVITTYHVTGQKMYYYGKVNAFAFPANELIITEGATCVEDAALHGHQRDVTVAEAIEMGLDYIKWEELDSKDKEVTEYTEAAEARRGHSVGDRTEKSEDVTRHKFMLTEAYVEYDLDGTGQPQKYRFWFGGTNYVYLDHEKIEDWCIDLTITNNRRFAPHGISIPDLTVADQDIQTVVLRSVLDNLLAANNPRPWADPTRVNFDDLLNNAIGAPVRTRGDVGPTTQEIPYVGNNVMPTMDYLKRQVEEKVGVTSAARGLDPETMQSTDKEAVANTIRLSQGQIDLIVTNVIYSLIIPMFKKLLKLEQRYFNPIQPVTFQGVTVPVNIRNFSYDMPCYPRIGVGKPSREERRMALAEVIVKQKEVMAEFGMDNPMVSLAQQYRAIEDYFRLSGISDTSRYFTVITPAMEKAIRQGMAEEAAQAAEAAKADKPIDPAEALITVEGGKLRAKVMEATNKAAQDARELELRAIEASERLRYERDKLAQDRILDLTKISKQGEGKAVDIEAMNRKIKAAQEGDDNDDGSRKVAEAGRQTEGTGGGEAPTGSGVSSVPVQSEDGTAASTGDNGPSVT